MGAKKIDFTSLYIQVAKNKTGRWLFDLNQKCINQGLTIILTKFGRSILYRVILIVNRTPCIFWCHWMLN